MTPLDGLIHDVRSKCASRQHLVITTGADRLPELPPYIKAVQGKEFPASFGPPGPRS